MRIRYAGSDSLESLLAAKETPAEVSDAVRGIIALVRQQGDKALYSLTERFDKAVLLSLKVSPEEIVAAYEGMDAGFLDVLHAAADNIRAFHLAQLRQSIILSPRPGLTCGQRVLPIEKIGIYVPGGTAAYPSSVLMNAIPAAIAGCPEIVMVTPPRPDGSISPAILAAAKVAGVTRIFKLGGAQAVAALAYGTESVPRVDKIVGPGNAYVAEAKRQVFGQVAIDMAAGPSEILVIADSSANPLWVAADLLSQAEHDPLASAVLLTPDGDLAKAVQEEISRQLETLPRKAIAAASIAGRGSIIVTGSLDEALAIANTLAPEHLELCVEKPFDMLDRVKNAGSVFLGSYCPEAMGDYIIGCNHVLPTGGTARFSSPLSVDDFIKKMQFSYYTGEAQGREAAAAALFARAEGLEAHARSALCRLERGSQP